MINSTAAAPAVQLRDELSGTTERIFGSKTCSFTGCPAVATQQFQQSTVLITPDVAAHLTQEPPFRAPHFRSNRRISPVHVGVLAAEMLAGDWRLSHQGISFSQDGRLEDGWHRCKASAQSGVPFHTAVSFGSEAQVFDKLDTGRRRRPDQFLDPNGTHGRIITSATTWLIFVASRKPEDQSFGWRPGAIDSLIYDWEPEWPDLHEYAPQVKTAFARRLIPAGPHLALMCIAAQSSHAAQVDPWLSAICDPEWNGLPASSPPVKLSEKLSMPSITTSRGQAKRHAVWGAMTKAWNAFAEGRDISGIIRSGPTERIPRVAGYSYK